MKYEAGDIIIVKEGNLYFMAMIDFISPFGDIRACSIICERCFTCDSTNYIIMGHAKEECTSESGYFTEKDLPKYLDTNVCDHF